MYINSSNSHLGNAIRDAVISWAVSKLGDKLTNDPDRAFNVSSEGISIIKQNQEAYPPKRECAQEFSVIAKSPFSTIFNTNFQPLHLFRTHAFKFKMLLEYDGASIIAARIMPLRQKTGKPDGVLNISFIPEERIHTPPHVESKYPGIAKALFVVNGDWKPSTATAPYSFFGTIHVWGNGRISYVMGEPESAMVDFLPENNNCDFTPPQSQNNSQKKEINIKPILFEENKYTIPDSIKKILMKDLIHLDDLTKYRIRTRKLQFILLGYASKKGGEASNRNMTLSINRAQAVKKIIKTIFPDAIVLAEHEGAYRGRTPSGLIEHIQRMAIGEKFDQAVTVRLENANEST